MRSRLKQVKRGEITKSPYNAAVLPRISKSHSRLSRNPKMDNALFKIDETSPKKFTFTRRQASNRTNSLNTSLYSKLRSTTCIENSVIKSNRKLTSESSSNTSEAKKTKINEYFSTIYKTRLPVSITSKKSSATNLRRKGRNSL